MIKIEIDGVEVEAEAGSMIIQVADRIQVPIPRFCYHSKLSVAANCRMCLVQVEKVPKALPACATPITEGMKIWTKSKIAIDAQKSVMEFLLINHPLDCPICDQGGECELQDVSMNYGRDISEFSETKRTVLDKNLGPLIATDMTRCIQCTRCVRFGQEIAGQREMGATGRGEFVEITTFIEQNIDSEVSGNIIDLCPVGALTSKPFRFQARAWELSAHSAIAPHDCIGSNLLLHVRNNTVMRVVPKHSEDLNEVWLSDRDRFSYQALQHDDRLRKPMLCRESRLSLVSWNEALSYSAEALKLCLNKYGAAQIGALISPNASVEEQFLLQKLMRALGSDNIDHRLRQQDFSDQDQSPLFPNLGIKFKELEQQDAILLIGSQIHKELPIAGLKLRKASLRGSKICMVNPAHFAVNFNVQADLVRPAADMLRSLAGIAKALLVLNTKNKIPAAEKLLANIEASQQEQEVASILYNSGEKRLVVLGHLALMHPKSSQLRAMAQLISDMIGAKLGCFSDGANSAGAWLSGCVPHRLPGGITTDNIGQNAQQMLQQPLKCYILFGLEPEFDSLWGEQALAILAQADFVVALSSYQSPALIDIADVILPLAGFAENSGTMINMDGTWQSTSNVVHPFADSRPGWKVLRVLANFCGLEGFNYDSYSEVLEELHKTIDTQIIQKNNVITNWQLPTVLDLESPKLGFVRVAPLSLYASDAMVRRASALQATKDAIAQIFVQLNPATAKTLGIANGDLLNVKSGTAIAQINAEISEQIPEQSVLIHQAHAQSNCLGAAYATVEISLC